MHLLQARPGGYLDEEGIAYLPQDPAPIAVLSSADSELALLARAVEARPADAPAVRLASVLVLRQHAAIDLYCEEVLRQARVIVVSLLGGRAYWTYGVERLEALARETGAHLVLVPGDDQPDPDLTARSTVEPTDAQRVWRYLREGGMDNAVALLDFLAWRYLGQGSEPPPPRPLPRVVLHLPGEGAGDLARWQARHPGPGPVALVPFYRAHYQAGETAWVDELAEALEAAGLRPLLVAVASLKDPHCLAVLEEMTRRTGVHVVLNATAFAIGRVDDPEERPLPWDVPVLQLLLASSDRQDWAEGTHGLRPRDLAMQVALPEVDGRITTRAIAFKDRLGYSDRSQSDLIGHRPEPERIRFVARLARAWCDLARTPPQRRRLALILANYPTREARLGNGVGLDTPASTVAILRALADAGHHVEDLPADGDELMARLRAGVTNDPDTRDLRPARQSIDLATYRAWLAELPEALVRQVEDRWGPPEADPMTRRGRLMIPGLRLGHVFVGIQPARGYHIDLAASYHDPDLVPPHAYLAFYLWLRHRWGAQAVVHVGKHGNLEWLPGKGVALGPTCWPDALLGPTPHLYPFIVNDPGEGAQAKRRAQAVIIDHLMPPLTRAETYGPLSELERRVDEYYEAAQLDPPRARALREEILREARALHLDEELGAGDDDRFLGALDAYLCEIKESQIRDGLHILGHAPQGAQRSDTLAALVRLPQGERPGLVQALADHFGLDCDPYAVEDFARPWNGPRPAILAALDEAPWRTLGDTRERLEKLARRLIDRLPAIPDWLDGPAREVLVFVRDELAGRLEESARREIQALLHGLAGGFVPPGPSGAPSRGRLDVLPTGRNFYGIDTRAVPTPTAWRLGWESAQRLLERYLQDHGDFPRRIGLSVWGTATMRTGGDDIAQALALLGVRPRWAPGGNRVVDFEILPLDVLDRPRVDVTLRVSGFFRDAFPNVIRLFDQAVRAVAALDEDETDNPLAARVRREAAEAEARGADPASARLHAGRRIFGSKPGAYGAGLQGLIDGRNWEDRADLARAYLNWGGYAYGSDEHGAPAFEQFRRRLGELDAVMHNQDNREHDILDSDDYYQFQGGMAAAGAVFGEGAPAVYHGDHHDPARPRIRSLKEEIARVVRARVVNPKWLAAARRHGYKGAFEMAATVDYLFAYDATTGLVGDHQYAMVADAYLLDADNRRFLETHNPDALREMSERLLEAMERGLWREPGAYREALEALLAEAEDALER